ncbi:unnamed protein product [Tilletia controversa]|uniref:Alpha/beta hydrolase fold-3 domain-containing protein n=3 Tax=Tilletia TaxID=13289 RepID=A0A8X7MXF6_9BASI|nr:hypothetical protein CF336_g2156 [Tilletia laevis]KAE8202782.1 hypothetical protein CF328_g2018 [Tilletia controversa]KAE8263485.1 hypothetical protein A4X03_0g1644 [Tilletia caries]KAE8207054.1 hypothetical protein CF335_g1432 [Tilletia laevis]KAE8251824.1 hypothetical protein A4X06_0g2524 [Tilletia controversa]
MSRQVWLLRAQLLPLAVVGLYSLVIIALLTPFFQTHFVFLHSVNFPFHANFSNPERYGIATSKARNIRIKTSDGLSLGAWHIVPDAFYHKVHPKFTSPGLQSSDYESALRTFPTVIYFHGNAGNRAAPFRTATYAYITSRLHANVVAIDYRGFGDSKAPGVTPSEAGLGRDARAAWDWVVQNTAGDSDADREFAAGARIVLMGQSLGTGVASRLALEVTNEGHPPQALVLIAPYASLRSLVLDYRLGGMIPVMGPLKRMPGIDALIDNYLITQFNSTDALSKLYFGTRSKDSRPVPHLVLTHATSDDVIPFRHSEHLFDTLEKAEYERRSDGLGQGSHTLQMNDIDGFGRISHLDLENTHTPQARVGGQEGGHIERSATVNLVRTHWGGHNTGFSEGVADFVRQLVGWTADGLQT